MRDIMKLKEKYPCPPSKDICKVINRYISTSDAFIQENELRIAETQKKIEELSNQLSIVKGKLDDDKKLLQEKTTELKAENERLREMEQERNRILQENHALEKKCHKLRLIKPNDKDQSILDLGQKKFNLYKQWTRIRWNYGTLDQETKGLICDKKNYVKTFSFPKEIQGEELSNLLWKEIELSTQSKFHDDGDKENSSLNTRNN